MSAASKCANLAADMLSTSLKKGEADAIDFRQRCVCVCVCVCTYMHVCLYIYKSGAIREGHRGARLQA